MARASTKYDGRRFTAARARDDDSLLSLSPLAVVAENRRLDEPEKSSSEEEEDATDGTDEIDLDCCLRGTTNERLRRQLDILDRTFLLLLDDGLPDVDEALLLALAKPELLAVILAVFGNDVKLERTERGRKNAEEAIKKRRGVHANGDGTRLAAAETIVVDDLDALMRDLTNELGGTARCFIIFELLKQVKRACVNFC